jgi:hypothetical protein
MTFAGLMNYFTPANTMEIILAVLLFMILVSLLRMSRDPGNSLNLKDLVTVNGRLEERKFTRFGAWIISTWGFVYIIVNSPTQFPEWYFVGYMTVWVGNAIMGKYVGTMSPQVPQQPQKEL